MGMDKRKEDILFAIIQSYITNGEPVGSRTLSKKPELGVSSATIRNEMSDLEELGYLLKPHTSAGRIPSDKAYRAYVDKLLKVNTVELIDKNTIKQDLLKDLREVEQVIQNGTKILSQLTNYTSIAISPAVGASKLKNLQLVPVDNSRILMVLVSDTGVVKNSFLRVEKELDEEQLNAINEHLNKKLRGKFFYELNTLFADQVFGDLIEYRTNFIDWAPMLFETLDKLNDINVISDGLSNIFEYPEYGDSEKAREIIHLIEDKSKLKDVLKEGGTTNAITISIGEENSCNQLKDCSVITARYSLNGMEIGKIGVVGPKRMRYSSVIPILKSIVTNINDILDEYFKET